MKSELQAPTPGPEKAAPQTCQHFDNQTTGRCGRVATHRASGGTFLRADGWIALCDEHAAEYRDAGAPWQVRAFNDGTRVDVDPPKPATTEPQPDPAKEPAANDGKELSSGV